ncbi:hypothetical protein [Parachryseolinea silvisoli]|uniref:hypothetical protein n=1 Tax=Parachryseolinea silvisoli TaxID=2873601 RepID=UPI002265BD96|nr:hypothetical protein [Parachryseolinea silvisoli]MCD9017630.1 hypothetical protein [Parachryseolinea silvisoli]
MKECVTWAVCLYLLLLMGCGRTRGVEEKTPLPESDSASMPNAGSLTEESDDSVWVTGNTITYGGVQEDSVHAILHTLPPLEPLLKLVRRMIRAQDSLQQDSVATAPYRQQVNRAIEDYKRITAAGIRMPENFPTLLQLNRPIQDGDTAGGQLPSARSSFLTTRSNFFFAGGAPFLIKIEPDDNTAFTTPQGMPEIRVEARETENTEYLLPLVYRYGETSAKILPGRVHQFYDRPDFGLRMLVHQFTRRIPVFFLTERGLIETQLLSIMVQLHPEELGCSYDRPTLQFACQKLLSSDEILGIYIPFDTTMPSSCTINRKDRTHWEADLNGDGIADIAAITSIFPGEVNGDALARVLWFVNVDGQWQIIDFGEDVDCT